MGGFRLGMAKGGEREGFRRGGILGCVDGGEGSPSLASSAVLASLPKRLPPPPPPPPPTPPLDMDRVIGGIVFVFWFSVVVVMWKRKFGKQLLKKWWVEGKRGWK